MRAKTIHDDTTRTFVLAFDPGDEVAEGLLRFARDHDLTAASFTAIGAFRRATLGFFDMEAKDYEKIEIDEQAEVLTMAGNVARHEGEPKVHAHVVLGKRDGTAVGGHLLEAYVRPTLEVVLTESPAHLQREVDETTGLPLLSL